MSIKFQRNYRITIIMANSSEQIVIQPPLTIEFNVNRNANASLNTLDLKIYNLNPNTRNNIFQDWQDQPTQQRNQIIVEAGYSQLSVIFTGTIFIANSYRDGSNIVTYINSLDGWFDTASARSNFTLAPTSVDGVKITDVLARLANDFPNLKLGKIGNIEGSLSRDVTVNGNTYEQIKKYSGNQCFVDNEQLFCLKNNEYIASNFNRIDASTGLLNVPRRSGALITLTTLFEPRVLMQQAIDLHSSVLPQYNGQYIIKGVSHNGTISEAIGGDCTTTLQMFSNQYFGKLTQV